MRGLVIGRWHRGQDDEVYRGEAGQGDDVRREARWAPPADPGVTAAARAASRAAQKPSAPFQRGIVADAARLRGCAESAVGTEIRWTAAGTEGRGRCPFHDGRDPSFTINLDKGVYHCFGCGVKGTVLQLAHRLNVPPPADSSSATAETVYQYGRGGEVLYEKVRSERRDGCAAARPRPCVERVTLCQRLTVRETDVLGSAIRSPSRRWCRRQAFAGIGLLSAQLPARHRLGKSEPGAVRLE